MFLFVYDYFFKESSKILQKKSFGCYLCVFILCMCYCYFFYCFSLCYVGDLGNMLQFVQGVVFIQFRDEVIFF